MKLTKTAGLTLGQKKPKGRKISTLKPRKRRPQTQKVKKNNNAKEEKYGQMKGQTRNTEVRINEEEIGKLPEKDLWFLPFLKQA